MPIRKTFERQDVDTNEIFKEKCRYIKKKHISMRENIKGKMHHRKKTLREIVATRQTLHGKIWWPSFLHPSDISDHPTIRWISKNLPPIHVVVHGCMFDTTWLHGRPHPIQTPAISENMGPITPIMSPRPAGVWFSKKISSYIWMRIHTYYYVRQCRCVPEHGVVDCRSGGNDASWNTHIASLH